MGRIKRFNDEQKQRFKQSLDSEIRTENWIKAKLERKYEDIPLKQSGLRTKALEIAQSENSPTKPAPVEVEILQKIIVRERLLSELTKLVKSSNSDKISSLLNEIIELIKALRYETLEIVEDIATWYSFQKSPNTTAQTYIRPFLYKGMNYLVKISSDLDFLDQYEEIVEKVCFEFKLNPFAYRGGGNIITGLGNTKSSEQYMNSLLKSYYEEGRVIVDGIGK